MKIMVLDLMRLEKIAKWASQTLTSWQIRRLGMPTSKSTTSSTRWIASPNTKSNSKNQLVLLLKCTPCNYFKEASTIPIILKMLPILKTTQMLIGKLSSILNSILYQIIMLLNLKNEGCLLSIMMSTTTPIHKHKIRTIYHPPNQHQISILKK